MRKTKSVSFSVPPEMEPLINQRAAQLQMDRSAYIRWLVEIELTKSGAIKPGQFDEPLPPRIRRGRVDTGSQ